MLEIKDIERDYTKPTNTVVTVGVVVFVAIVVVILYYFDLFNLKSQSEEVYTPPVLNQKTSIVSPKLDSLPADVQLETLNSRLVNKFPNIGQSVSISTKDLPISILNLLSFVTGNIKSESVEYLDGKKGFQLSFDMGTSLVSDFTSFTQSVDKNVWKIVFASYSQNAGVLSLDGEGFQILMNFIQREGSNTGVEMKIIVK